MFRQARGSPLRQKQHYAYKNFQTKDRKAITDKDRQRNSKSYSLPPRAGKAMLREDWPHSSPGCKASRGGWPAQAGVNHVNAFQRATLDLRLESPPNPSIKTRNKQNQTSKTREKEGGGDARRGGPSSSDVVIIQQSGCTFDRARTFEAQHVGGERRMEEPQHE